MKKIALLSLIFISFLSTDGFGQSKQTIRGIIIDADSERPMVGVNLLLVENGTGTQSDKNGEFVFEKMGVGRYALKASMTGYENLILTELLLESSKELRLTLKLKEQSSMLQEAIVRGGKARALTSIQKITTEQVMRFPATFMDPARLAMSYAGVANQNDQANALVIRGNSPNGLQWRLEGVEIVNPNHLSNAGTFSDRATQNAGGTNILSAQLLGEMDFMTGAFPAEYGNALSGVMDMRLRNGNDKKHEFTAQAGLIGVDLAAEGPLNKKGASYLINYRYSFTGILGLMGVTFGGEKIDFQDLSFNLSLPTQKLGKFTIFGMGGLSSNTFAGPSDAKTWVVQKDGFDIDFNNLMAATGITNDVNLGKNTHLRTVIAYSGLESERTAYIKSKTSVERFRAELDSVTKKRISFSTALSHKFSNKFTLKEGIFLTSQNDFILSYSRSAIATGNVAGLIIQPYITGQFSIGRLTANAGLHYLKYNYNQTKSLEPRLSAAYQMGANQTITAAYGLHSQLQLPQVYFSRLINEEETNRGLGFSKAHHFVIGHELKLKNNASFKTEVYYQNLFGVPVVTKAPFDTRRNLTTFSALNLVESYIDEKLENAGKGTNYGVEMTFQKYLTKGFYTLLTGSLYKASYTGGNGQTYNARFNGRHTFNATFGKEFYTKKGSVLGANLRAVWLGGFWDSAIDIEATKNSRYTVYDTKNPFSIRQKDYFRPDMRVYFKRNKNHYTRTFSMDIQNFISYKNVAYSYYDILQKQVVVQNQMGLIPMLNYRVEF
jgi:CarboxypepD_reg-like domain/TonB-dependent Receptor Plug Domain